MPTPTPPIPVIINATAGLGWDDERCRELEKLFEAAGATAVVHMAKDPEDLRGLVQAALASAPPVLVAGGGDGTLSTVAALLAPTSTALGILPLGTLNHFARDLGIPLDAAEAIAAIVRGRTVDVDLGEVNDRPFINNSSLGIYTRIVRDRDRRRRTGLGKRWAMAWATLAALRRSRLLDVSLTLDGEERHYRAPFVFIGNNRYVVEGFGMGRRDRLREGRLSIYVTWRTGGVGLVTLALRALFGRLKQAPDFAAGTTHAITVNSRRGALPVAADGEVFLLQTPLHYRIRPRALKVVAP
ncbi:MAG TPA: diacylglycerol kinase family protein [Usitatibacter sp.]|nr:diacylglycerol kinase family protein [Usitatibacter sp.]